jgi:hypothetical protein
MVAPKNKREPWNPKAIGLTCSLDGTWAGYNLWFRIEVAIHDDGHLFVSEMLGAWSSGGSYVRSLCSCLVLQLVLKLWSVIKTSDRWSPNGVRLSCSACALSFHCWHVCVLHSCVACSARGRTRCGVACGGRPGPRIRMGILLEGVPQTWVGIIAINLISFP